MNKIDEKELKSIKVSGASPTKETAGSILKAYESGHRNIELRAIGASAVSQMFKAMATASSLFAQKGLSLTFRAGYDTVIINGNDKTVLVAKLIVG